MTTTIDRDEYMRKFEEWRKAQEPAQEPEIVNPVKTLWTGHYECAKCGCTEHYRPSIDAGEFLMAIVFSIVLPLLFIPMALVLTVPVLVFAIPIRAMTTPRHCSDCGSSRIKWVNETT